MSRFQMRVGFATGPSQPTTGGTLTVSENHSPSEAQTNQVVTFTAAASGGSGTGYTFAWEFGDGSTGSGATTTHAYAAADTYTFKVTATDSAGNTGFFLNSIVIGGITITSPGSYQIVAGVSYQFTASATGGTAPYTYSWNFGDGSPAVVGQTVNHTYTAAAGYTVTVTVTDSLGSTAQATASAAVNAAPGNINVTGSTLSTDTPDLNETVTGNGVATGGTGGYTFVWNWGDGSTDSTGPVVTHSWSAPGTYTVTVTATDSEGSSASGIFLVNVATGLGVTIEVS